MSPTSRYDVNEQKTSTLRKAARGPPPPPLAVYSTLSPKSHALYVPKGAKEIPDTRYRVYHQGWRCFTSSLIATTRGNNLREAVGHRSAQRISSAQTSLRLYAAPPKHQCIRRCHPYARNPPHKRFVVGLQLTLHASRRTPHGASRWVQACLPGR